MPSVSHPFYFFLMNAFPTSVMPFFPFLLFWFFFTFFNYFCNFLNFFYSLLFYYFFIFRLLFNFFFLLLFYIFLLLFSFYINFLFSYYFFAFPLLFATLCYFFAHYVFPILFFSLLVLVCIFNLTFSCPPFVQFCMLFCGYATSCSLLFWFAPNCPLLSLSLLSWNKMEKIRKSHYYAKLSLRKCKMIAVYCLPSCSWPAVGQTLKRPLKWECGDISW